jgi:hypothetical protein
MTWGDDVVEDDGPDEKDVQQQQGDEDAAELAARFGLRPGILVHGHGGDIVLAPAGHVEPACDAAFWVVW